MSVMRSNKGVGSPPQKKEKYITIWQKYCRKFSPSSENIVKKLSAEFESQSSTPSSSSAAAAAPSNVPEAAPPKVPTSAPPKAARKSGAAVVFNGLPTSQLPSNKSFDSCDSMTADDSLLPSLDPGESMLLEEQFERLAADVSAGAADKAADIRYTRNFFYWKYLNKKFCLDCQLWMSFSRVAST